MKQSRTAFFSVVFPQNQDYFQEFLQSLERQTDHDFDLILLEDEWPEMERFMLSTRLNIRIFPASFGISGNRKYGLELVKSEGYDYLIFGDSDDYFDLNRVEVAKRYLQGYDLVVNDLKVLSTGRLGKGYFSKRLENGFRPDHEFLYDKNIMGMSNTALNVKLIDDIHFPPELRVVDWYFFTLLMQRGARAVFTTETSTVYRQHHENMIGLQETAPENLREQLIRKVDHYTYLSHVDPVFQDKADSGKKLLEFISSEKGFNEYYQRIKQQSIPQPFWWEELSFDL